MGCFVSPFHIFDLRLHIFLISSAVLYRHCLRTKAGLCPTRQAIHCPKDSFGECLRVMSGGGGDQIVGNEFALGIYFCVILITIVVLVILLGPTGIGVFLTQFGRLFLLQRSPSDHSCGTVPSLILAFSCLLLR